MSHNKLNLKSTYTRWVKHWLEASPERDEAMHLAVGGNFESVGRIEVALLRHFGLRPHDYLIDVGCGSGRLAKPLSDYLSGNYLGFDLAEELVTYARDLVGRPEWRFEVIDHIEVPEQDGKADMVCFFSVLTHLLHEQSYWYLEEAQRVLRPGGTIIFSFLEFREKAHWPIFSATLNEEKRQGIHPLNVFLDREAIAVWADHLGLTMVDIRGATDPIVPEGALGQSICVLKKPA